MVSLVTRSTARSQFEEHLKSVVEKVTKNDSEIMLYIEWHTVIRADSINGSIHASNLLKPALVRRNLLYISVTTIKINIRS